MKQTNHVRLPLDKIFYLFERFFNSGLSLAAFGRQENIPYPRLNRYRRRLVKAQLLDPGSNSLNESRTNATKKPAQFIQVVSNEQKSDVDSPFVLKAGGFQLSIPSSFQTESLSNILEVLKHHV